ncbi:sensor histidine kinase [Nibrella saemangeumensis]
MMAIFIVVFVAYYQQKQVKQQLALKELQEKYRRELMAATFQGQEQERRRLARDLHDEIGTMLSVTKMSLNQLDRKLTDNVPASLLLQRTRSLLDETMSNVRRISRDLVPTTLDRFGLVAALEELIEKTTDGDIHIQLECNATLDNLTSPMEVMLYRIAQELVNNGIKHARATQITIQLFCQENEVRLSVVDNGHGFDFDDVMKDRDRGLGLRNIESRLSVVDGHVTFDVAPGRGSKIYVQVPLPQSEPEPELV